MSSTVALELWGTVARVTLSNPSRFNAMSRAMWRELRSVFERLQQMPQLHCVVVIGAAVGQGAHFCAGGDISEYPSFRFEEASLRDFHENDVWGGLQAMLDCDLPLIAQIEGNCMGAGVEIASCCDLRIASDDARFGAPIAKLGFPMAPREAALVSSAVGVLTAKEMLLSAAILTADEMHQRGFLNRVVPTADLGHAVQTVTERMQSLAPGAARLNKQCFRALSQSGKAQAAPDLIAHSYRYADAAEHKEGIAAFLEKRPARFVT